MVNRRTTLLLMSGAALAPTAALARTARQIQWDDLIPPGVAYSQIIGEGEIDYANDTWNPIYDENAVKLNETLDGLYVRLPAFIVPFDTSAKGITEFMLVPYVGACVHTPPPPANQLVLGRTKKPWQNANLWDPIWATGVLRTQLKSTDLGQTGYALAVEKMEPYEW